MNFGITIPNFDICGDPRVAVQLAQIAEEAGWDGFFLWDHVLWTWPHPMPVSDPYTVLAAMAMATSRIKLGTMVTPVPRRRPWTLARQLTTLDRLSGGRAIAGVGLGGDWFGDYSKFGEATEQKVHGEMLDEGLQIMAGLWSGEPFSFEGKHFRIKDAQFLPKPLQEPRIPIWVAGNWPNKKPFRRAAQWDGMYPLIANEERDATVDEAREMLAYIREFRQSDAPFDFVVSGSLLSKEQAKEREKAAAMAEVGATWWLSGGWPPLELDAVRAALEQGPPR